MMNPDQEALYQTILDEPDLDEPRLVYADWLEETGEEANILRAEFIRVQCQLESIQQSMCFCRYDGPIHGDNTPNLIQCPMCELRCREYELWETTSIEAGWMIRDCILRREIPHHHLIPQNNLANSKSPNISPIFVYHCGFPAEVRCTMQQFLNHTKELTRFPIRKVVITDKEPYRYDDGIVWLEYPAEHYHPENARWHLPRVIIDLLKENWYTTVDLAVADLNNSALLHLRSQR